MFKLRDELLGQLDWHWTSMLRPRLGGLTDEEYLWEPVPGCWSVRLTDGRWIVDGWPPPDLEDRSADLAPFTTIAWRLCHIGGCLLGHNNLHFGDRSFNPNEPTLGVGTASEALRLLDDAYGGWKRNLDGLPPEQFEQPGRAPDCAPSAVQDPVDGRASYPFARVVLNVNKEVIHHGAEVGVLRDLYARRQR